MNKKHALFIVFTFVFALVVIELFSFTANELLFKSWSIPAETQEDADSTSRGFNMAMIEKEMVHPYAGYALNPKKLTSAGEHGWFLEPTIEESNSTENIHVAIIGGSVAANFFADLSEDVRKEFGSKFPNRKVFVSGLAVGGYKQPQQYLIVSYLLSIGYHFDYVINIDGFNEAILPFSDNYLQGIYPAYPRSWKWRIQDGQDRTSLMLAQELASAQKRQKQWNDLFHSPFLRWSNTAELVRIFRDVRLRKYELDVQLRMKSYKQSDKLNYPGTGPSFSGDKDAVFRSSAELWARASILMFNLAKTSGFKYLHVLQPNQYLPDSKIFTTDEKIMAFNPDGYGSFVPSAYALLKDQSKKFKAAGLPFIDLSDAFSDSKETLYTDSCCHFNKEGNRILFGKMKPYIFD